MIQNLEQIEYRKGMLKKGMKIESLPVKVWVRLRRAFDISLDLPPQNSTRVNVGFRVVEVEIRRKRHEEEAVHGGAEVRQRRATS
ncbi:MAG: hypothetical protein Kow0089_05830 [Desulfobulbaceae bacterium]